MLKRKKEIIAKVMATTMLASTLTSTFTTNVSAAEPQTKATVSETTIAGDDRYKTAVEISKNYSSTSKHAVIVNGQKGIVDALTATPYASLKKAPILMTQSTKLNADTKKELTRRGVKTVDIVGGVNSVSDAVKAEIEAMGIKVNRIAGDSKYDTALEVAKKIDGISNISKIAVANGEVLADAVSVAAPAAQNKMPIILAHPTKGLDAEVKKYIDGEDISTSYVIGGTSSVSTTTQNSLPGTKKRLEGTDRQGTNASVIKEFYTSSSYDNMYVAKSGQVNKADEIADALAVGVLAASNQDPVMLVGKNLGSTQKTLLESKDLEKITKVGGNIPTASIDAIKNTQSSTKTVTTVAELKTALANAKDGDIINFNPSTTVSEAVSLSTTKNVTVNLNGTHSGAVSVDMANGTLNINGNISNKVSVDAVKSINVKSGVTIKHLEIKSGAKNASIANNGTVTTFDVLATGVKINNAGKIDVLNQLGDTVVEGNGIVGNIDTTKPVSQIIVQNAKELVIRFSNTVDKSSVVTSDGKIATTSSINHINITSTTGNNAGSTITVSGCTAKLSENGTVLTITPKAGEYFKGKYDITVQNVTSNAIVLDKYTTVITANDTTPVTISQATYNQSEDRFEITLSEPVESSLPGLVLRVNNSNGSPINVTGTIDPTDSRKIYFARPADINLNSTINIYMAGLKDGALNVMEAKNTSVSTTNTRLAVTSYTQYDNNKVKIVFNKKLSDESNKKITGSSDRGIVITKSTTAGSADIITGISKADTSIDPTGRTYIATLNPAHLFESRDTQTVGIKVTENVYTDNTSTKVSALDNTLTLTKDKMIPKVESIKVSADKKSFEVAMNKDIENIVLNKGVSFTLDGVRLTGSSTNIDYKDVNNKKVLVVTPASADKLADGRLKSGTYQITIAEGALKDKNNLVNEKNTISNIVVPKYPVSNVDVVINNMSGEQNKNKFKITFAPEFSSEEFVYEGGTLNRSNFILGDDIVPEGTEIEFKDGNKSIVLRLPSVNSVDKINSAVLKVSGLKTKSGNIVNPAQNTVTLVDNTAAKLTEAKVEKNTTDKKVRITLKFSENINNEIKDSTSIDDILDELIIKQGSGETPLSYTGEAGEAKDDVVYSVKGDTLVMVITAKTGSNLMEVVSDKVTIETKAPTTPNLKDLSGLPVKVGEKLTVTSIATTDKME